MRQFNHLKYLTLFTLGALIASCTKTYTCTCELAGTIDARDYSNVSKEDALILEEECELSDLCTWSEK